jgi:KUP system potassium uptake protein
MSKTASRESFAALALGAMGVVYGDIGTSPLYTMKEVFSPATGIPLDATHLIGAVSVIFWGLMLVVTLKYVLLILRADNRGEGGIMALTALAAEAAGSTRRRRTALLLAGVLGAALFYGDSVITPAISVLSAVEGLEVATPALKAYVIPISVAVLIGLFAVQRHGTAVVGKLFGPVILVWFGVLALFGILEIVRQPAILAALNPLNGLAFLHDAGLAGVCRGGRHRAGLHRGRGAVCRHGALRQETDPAGLDRPGAAGPGHQLHGPGRAADA